MKNRFLAFTSFLVVAFLPACTPDSIAIVQNTDTQVQVDTIITIDAQTFEETVQVVVSKQKETPTKNTVAPLSPDEVYQVDTIITFNPDTYEETIQLVKRKVKKKN